MKLNPMDLGVCGVNQTFYAGTLKFDTEGAATGVMLCELPKNTIVVRGIAVVNEAFDASTTPSRSAKRPQPTRLSALPSSRRGPSVPTRAMSLWTWARKRLFMPSTRRAAMPPPLARSIFTLRSLQPRRAKA